MKKLKDKISSEAFQESIPVIVTSFINKIGTIGISLIPLLLVEKHFSSAQSSTVMSLIRSVMLFGIILSGFISDRIGLKRSVLSAYGFSVVGLSLLPFQNTFMLVAVCGMIAQFGHTMGNVNIRLILSETVSRKNQKEAFGWIRVVNNLGQVFSYFLAMLATGYGITVLMLFDGFTSLMAMFYGTKKLPGTKSDNVKKDEANAKEDATPHSNSLFAFVSFAIVVSIWSFLYDLYFVGVAAKMKLIFPETGIRYFSFAMLMNTALCAGLAVWSTKVFKDVMKSFTLSLVVTAVAVVIALFNVHSLFLILFGSLFATFGEIIYGSLAHFVLIRTNPSKENANLYYSSALFIANIGRIIAAAVCFPLIVYTENYTKIYLIMFASAIFATALLVINRKTIVKAVA